ncbi:hypothetical protein, conserved [Angomonas deanei]|uniref:Uncharacterized protein n=1 Tax=Angomonas deanei TaxID=59799 RepID=A0A7G2CR42_9TRYP|nr:hypothetical protein, conserved [Angomonas deanei]
MKRCLPRCSVSNNATKITPTGTYNGPYPTDGGKVPIYSMVNGVIQKRYWVYKNPNWCELCKEPVSLWVNHMGRKDHALMDLHYTALVECPRRWDPTVLAAELAKDLGVDITGYQRQFGRMDGERRNEIYAMLVELEAGGMLYFGEPRSTYLTRMQGSFRGHDHQGSIVLHRYLIAPFVRLFPYAHIQDLSNLLDFVSCSYNMETVYDLCSMYTLDTVAIKANYKSSSPVALGLGGAAAGSSASGGYENQKPVSEEPSKEEQEEAFSRKAIFVRQILGQLRWLSLPDQEHPAGYTFPPYMITLGEILLKALVAEIILARLCEYMVRAEPVWQSCGFERMTKDFNKIVREGNDIRPKPVRYSYRRLSDSYDDLYRMSNNKMEGDVADALRRKGVPIPASLSVAGVQESHKSPSVSPPINK